MKADDAKSLMIDKIKEYINDLDLTDLQAKSLVDFATKQINEKGLLTLEALEKMKNQVAIYGGYNPDTMKSGQRERVTKMRRSMTYGQAKDFVKKMEELYDAQTINVTRNTLILETNDNKLYINDGILYQSLLKTKYETKIEALNNQRNLLNTIIAREERKWKILQDKEYLGELYNQLNAVDDELDSLEEKLKGVQVYGSKKLQRPAKVWESTSLTTSTD